MTRPPVTPPESDLVLSSGRGLRRDGQPMQQRRRIAADRPGGGACQQSDHASARRLVRSRREEVHLRREEDLLPLRHL